MIQRFFNVIVLLVLVGVMTSCGYSQSRARVYSYSSSQKGKGWLGVEVQNVTKKLQEKENLSVKEGAYVSEVNEDSPAEKADIKEGDVIVKFDGQSIADGDDLIREVRRAKPNSDVKVELVRKGETKTLAVTIGRVPGAMAFGFNNNMRMPVFPRMPSMPHMPSAPHFFLQSDKNGLEVTSLSRQLAEFLEVPDKNGLLVSSVKKGSGAEKAGFKAGDVLVKIDGRKVKNIEDLTDALDDNDKDADLPCDVIRKGKAITLKWHIEADDRDEDDDDYSFDSFSPGASPQMKLEQLHRSLLHSPELGRVRENLDRLREQLHQRMEELKERIHERISSIWQEIRNSFA